MNTLSADLIQMPCTDSADYSSNDYGIVPIIHCDVCGERLRASQGAGHSLTECLQTIIIRLNGANGEAQSKG